MMDLKLEILRTNLASGEKRLEMAVEKLVI